ncbi:hypothetical protein [uncultured Phascolarctobacterium sp.]|jgi:hypothetical protein|uniref:hypothetical protein n=1 Tax=uncultured Phascolarctobacterium sp. TaxID=512296 RepID=UPI0015A87E5C|nr:hypothetical protein [uncultured Phascolarctobacterium sp.]DAE91819.1 MAG TPA: protein of unknown function DUF4376 [Caudoviricetes sp.]
MYYIFNENGECVASCNYEPDADDLASRNEIAVVSEESYDIGKIKLVNGVIIEVVNEPTLEELKVTKLSEIGVWTERKITGGFVSECSGEIVTYDSDRDTQNTVSSDLNTIYLAPEKFGKNFPSGYPMRGYPKNSDSKQIYFLTKEQLLQWNVDLGLHRGICKQNGWIKQEQVKNAIDKSELETVILD